MSSQLPSNLVVRQMSRLCGLLLACWLLSHVSYKLKGSARDMCKDKIQLSQSLPNTHSSITV